MLERIFRKHGAVHIGIPLLMPKCSLYDANDAYVCLMDRSGGLVSLPYDSRVSQVTFHCTLAAVLYLYAFFAFTPLDWYKKGILFAKTYSINPAIKVVLPWSVCDRQDIAF